MIFIRKLKTFQYQINRYVRTKEYMNANHKFDTRLVFTFLGNEKELILCCVNQERQEWLQKKKKTRPLQMKVQKQFVPEEARYKVQHFEENIEEKYNPTKNIYMYLKDQELSLHFQKGKINK